MKNSLRDLESLLLAYGPQPSFDDMGWYVRDSFPGNEKVYDTVSDVKESHGQFAMKILTPNRIH